MNFNKRSNDPILTQKIQLKKAEILLSQASKELHPDYNIEAIKIYDSIIKMNNQTNAAQTALEQKAICYFKIINCSASKIHL